MKNIEHILKKCETREEQLDLIKDSINSLNVLLKEYEIDIEELKLNVKVFGERVKGILNDCDDNSFYYLENNYKPGTEDIRWKTEGVFKTKVALFDRIESFMDRIWEYSEEDVWECMWWEITKYKQSNGYEKLYTVYLSADKELIGIGFEQNNLNLLNEDEMKICEEYTNRFGMNKSVIILFPFVAGDMVRLNFSPYSSQIKSLVYSGFRDYFVGIHPQNGYTLKRIHNHLSDEYSAKIGFPEQHIVKTFSSDDLSLRMISAFLTEKPEYFLVEEHRSNENLNSLYLMLQDDKACITPELKERYPLNEYNKLYSNFKSHFENYFASPLKEDELYFLYLRKRDDNSDAIAHDTYRTFEAVYEYIQEQRYSRNYKEEEIWWKIERKKRIDNEYRTMSFLDLNIDDEYRTMSCLNLNIEGEPLSFNISSSFKNCVRDELSELLLSYLPIFELNDKSVIIDIPFEIGDIIRINIQPEGYDDYAIYLGELKVDNKKTHAGLIYSWRNENKFKVAPLSHLDFKYDEKYALYPFMEVAYSTGNHILPSSFSPIIKLHPELGEELLKMSKNLDPRGEDEIEKFMTWYYYRK